MGGDVKVEPPSLGESVGQKHGLGIGEHVIDAQRDTVRVDRVLQQCEKSHLVVVVAEFASCLRCGRVQGIEWQG